MQKIKMGMIGGGQGSFIGGVHRMAAALDGQIELVCGAFSSNPAKSKASGKDLFLPEHRVYASFEEMILEEKKLPEEERMDFVAIVTPNHMHYAPAKMALENGFHVVCDKPISFTLEEAYSLKSIVEETGLVFALTHNYTAHPMVKQAREIIASNKIGKVRKVVVEYLQGWLSTKLEDTEQKQASWRVDPSKSGIAGAIGDIGTHAANLAEYITNLQIKEVCADLSIFVEGRRLDDDANVLLRFDNGAKGILNVSQICAGEENNLTIRVYGEKGGIIWQQQEPNTLEVKHLDQPTQLLRTASVGIGQAATAVTRIPAGHPEGYLEAFATIYNKFAHVLQDIKAGNEPKAEDLDFPTVDEGIKGMLFINKVVASSEANQRWEALSTEEELVAYS